MVNFLLGPVLGAVFGHAMRRRGMAGVGGMGGLAGLPVRRALGRNRTALLMMLLPMAMRWVQRNGGMGAVLDRFRERGYGRQAQSWVAPQPNEPLDEQAVEQVVGHDELQQMAQRLGVPEHEVAQAFAAIVPQMVDRLTPRGELPPQADEVLDESTRELEQEIEDVQFREMKRPR